MTLSKGRFTLPAQAGMEKEVKELAEKWGVDAVRDSDGTKLSKEIQQMGFQVYSTLCLVREDLEWTKLNKDKYQQIYLMTDAETATSNTHEICLMKDYFEQQFQVDIKHDPKQWWEVIDRTTGTVLQGDEWTYSQENGLVKILKTVPFHSYTVTFLAWQIWEPVSMYNHLVNSWTQEHRPPVDPRHPKVREHLLKVLHTWLEEHPYTQIVRFTTFFYNFDLIYNEKGKERQVDWFGYASCVSPLAIEQFEKEYGYRPRPENFVDKGYYNTPFKNPSKFQLDWIDFNSRFVAKLAKECVDMVHATGRKAIMFLGDHLCGTEPYGKYFPEIGLDAVVGAGGDGVTLRMIADIPVKATEARFYPYFFPDIFHEGGDPVGESNPVWMKSRRAMLRNPVDRIGYGGYLSLAVKFPDFIEHVKGIANEFRSIHDNSKGTKAKKAPFKVAILNSWGSLRTWQTHQIAHSLWNQRCYSYLGILEALSGMEFDIEFINFEDVKANGISKEVGVIINAGDGDTSWSGGDNWKDEEVVTTIREWVYNGGGFIGAGEPSAYENNGMYFQLADVLGVQRETGFGVSRNKPKYIVEEEHFITKDLSSTIDFGEGTNSVYVAEVTTQVLAVDRSSVSLSVNNFGKGRAVYIAGLPYNTQNTRLLKRALYWSAGKEKDMYSYFAEDVNVECAVFEEAGNIAVINNSGETVRTKLYKDQENSSEISLEAYEMKWVKSSPSKVVKL